MLTATNITYAAGDKVLLDDVSVSFSPGKLSLIIGPNGAGKSTLIRALCGHINTTGGSVHFGDGNVATIPLADAARFRAVLSQNVDLAFPMKVSEVVMMGRYPHFIGAPAQKDLVACEEAMHFFDIPDIADRDYTTLSGGEKQRVHFARVAAQIWYPVKGGCRYLLLDEPLTFLDVRYQFGFMHKLRRLLEDNDIVIVGVVHDLNLAAKFADQLTLLHQGRVLANGTSQEVLTKENIRQAYQLEPVIHTDGKSMHLFFE